LLSSEICAGLADGGVLGVRRMQQLTSPKHQHPAVAKAMRYLLVVLWRCACNALDLPAIQEAPITAAQLEEILSELVIELEAEEAEEGQELMVVLDKELFPATEEEALISWEAACDAVEANSPICNLHTCERPPVFGDDGGISLAAFGISTPTSSTCSAETLDAGLAPPTPSAVSASIAPASTITVLTCSDASTVTYDAVVAA
jgi:hypothetical protein